MSRQEQGKSCYWIKRSLLASENLNISVKLSVDWTFGHTFECFSTYSDNSRAGEGGQLSDYFLSCTVDRISTITTNRAPSAITTASGLLLSETRFIL